MTIGATHTAIAARNASAPSAQRPALPGCGGMRPCHCFQRIAAYGTNASSGRKPTPLVKIPTPAANPPTKYQPQAGPSRQCRSRAYSDKVVRKHNVASIWAPRVTMRNCSVQTVINAAASPASRLTLRRPKS